MKMLKDNFEERSHLQLICIICHLGGIYLPLDKHLAMIWVSADMRSDRMKIKIEHGEYEEHEIILRCKELDSEIMRIIAFLNLQTQKLCGWKNREEITMLEFKDVYYAEAMEDKTFLYTADDVYQTALNLGEIEGRYESLGFLRISKSLVVNLYAIHSLKSAMAGRIEIMLKNKEKLIVSRHYAPLLRERIGL